MRDRLRLYLADQATWIAYRLDPARFYGHTQAVVPLATNEARLGMETEALNAKKAQR